MAEVVLSREDICGIVSQLGERLTKDLAGEVLPPIFLCVLKGALPFFADLIQNIKINIETDFTALSSYGGSTTSSGQVKMVTTPRLDYEGRSLVIVEDIIDTGFSMQFLVNYMKEHYHPKSIRLCALFDKPKARKVDVHVDYVGYELKEAKFLVGYGLDYGELLRNVPFVYVPSNEEIKELDKKIR